MSLEKSLEYVQNDIQNGDLGKARDRLHGLITSYPDHLELRSMLGNVYWQIQQPDMAGRYWYLEEEKDKRMEKACERFERQFKSDPVEMLFAIKYKGQLDLIINTYAGKTLNGLHQAAKAKHSWYEDYRKKGSEKYHHSPKYDSKRHKVRDTLFKGLFWILVILVITLLCVGVWGVINIFS